MGAKRKHLAPVNGWVNFFKPVGMTSTQAVGKIRHHMKARKAGHAGTLDPLASGILPIALGEATKTILYIQDSFKTYQFTVQWGQATTTDDQEGAVCNQSDAKPAQSDVEALLENYTGEIEQTPPQFSAVKIDGQRAYDLARGGQQVDIKSRIVFIEELKVLNHDEELNQTSFECYCGKGTYIRSLARDMGEDLSCFGHIVALKRTQVGPFTENNAISLDIIEKIGDNTATGDVLLPLESALDDIPALSLRQDEAAQLRQGQVLSFIAKPDVTRLEDIGLTPGQSDEENTVLAVLNGEPIGLVSIKNVRVKPAKIFNL